MNIKEQSELILRLTENLNEHIQNFKKGFAETQTQSASYIKREIVVLRAELNDLSKNISPF